MSGQASARFGLLLHRARIRCSLTVEELAEAANVSARAIEDLEAQKSLAPQPRNLRAIVDALRVRGLSVEDADALREAAGAAHESYRPRRKGTPKDDIASVARIVEPEEPIVGRERELAALRDHLRAHRLVTLTGTPGVGKTRLALAAAAQSADAFEHGVCLVELDEVVGHALVGARIALKLGIAEGDIALQSAEDAVVAFLSQRRMLVVLDTFEHVLGARTLVAKIVAHTPASVLITSRSPLRVTGEFEYEVKPLSTTADDGGDSDAVTLFNRAIAAQRGALAKSYPASELDDLCRLLDGIPLALELAAARTRYVAPRALAELFRAGVADLGEAREGAPNRQRTLDAALDWSYQLLSPGARRLFRWIGIFESSVDIKSIIALVDPQPAGDVLDFVVELINSGLLRQDDDNASRPYGLLNVIRQFARSQLDETGELHEAAEQHARLYADVVRAIRREAAAMGGYDEALRRRFDTQFADVWAAARWLAARHPERAGLVALAVGEYAELQGRHTESLEAYELAAQLGLVGEGGRGAGAVLRRLGRWPDAIRRLQAALTAVPISQRSDRAVLLTQMGWVLSVQSKFEEAFVVLNDAVEDADGMTRPLALAQLARLAGLRGSEHHALQDAARARGAAKAAGNAQVEVTVLRILGDAYRLSGQAAQADLVLTDALKLARRFGNSEEIGGCLLNLALAEQDLADGDRTLLASAIGRDREALAIFERIAHGSGRVTAHSNLAEKLGHAGQFEEAFAHAHAAVALARELDFRLGEGDSLDTLGYVHLDAGDPCAAIGPFTDAVEVFDGLGLAPSRERSLNGLKRAQSECAEGAAAKPR